VRVCVNAVLLLLIHIKNFISLLKFISSFFLRDNSESRSKVKCLSQGIYKQGCHKVLSCPTNCTGKYRLIFKDIDAFTAPRYSATGMLSAAGCMRVLSMTQHAWRPITFRMNENNKHVYDFCAVGSHELFLPSKHLISSVLRHGSLYFRATRICVWHLREIRDLLESVGENFDVNFVVQEFPADKQFTIGE
jgi:hypothetical protein